VAGLTLAALAIPEVLGYAKIAGMPVVTGLYTMLIPLVVFAVLGSSRHLVVGADSATAAILAAGLGGLAIAGPSRYVALAGTAALLAGGLLIVARVVGLGFLANFLSRTVLVGFLTGVGVQVAVGQLPDMLGVHVTGGSMIEKLVSLAHELPRAHPLTCAASVVVIVVVLGLRMFARRIPGALIVVVAAIVASRFTALASHGIAVLGNVPGGLPKPALPGLGWSDLTAVLPIAASMFVVILAQSSATSRAYAGKYDEAVDDDLDLVGLGAANVVAAFTGAFVVNGSPTKTEIVDSAGGRTQWSQLVTGGVVLVVLLFLTGPLAYLPLCVLAAVVFLIGAELVNVVGMRRIYAVRGTEFAVALITAIAVVFLGLEQGIVVAVVASIVDHLRHSYNPHSTVLRKSPEGHWHAKPVAAGERTVAGLVIYRFGSSLYFANASRLPVDVALLTGQGEHVDWFCLDAAAIGDVDYTAAAVLTRVRSQLAASGTRLVLANVIDPVRAELDRYGLTVQVGHDAFFDTAGSTLEHFTTRKDHP
jgi:high affinity sulfate transporter 1